MKRVWRFTRDFAKAAAIIALAWPWLLFVIDTGCVLATGLSCSVLDYGYTSWDIFERVILAVVYTVFAAIFLAGVAWLTGALGETPRGKPGKDICDDENSPDSV